jgi:polyphosphate kinase
MNWDIGYHGNTHALVGDAEVALSRPLEYTADAQDGRIVTAYIRAFETPIDLGAEAVIVQTYDPDVYYAYHLTLASAVEGREGCETQVFVPDLDAANRILLETLNELGPAEPAEEMGFPAMGAQFAQEVRLIGARASPARSRH